MINKLTNSCRNTKTYTKDNTMINTNQIHIRQNSSFNRSKAQIQAAEKEVRINFTMSGKK